MVLEQEKKLGPTKVVAIISDLDGTLWSGILAEKEKLKLNKDYYVFLETCSKKGIQIIIISKNDEKDVLDAFKKLKIKEDLFTGIFANWDPKYLNIEKILELTEFRPETVFFIDDNPLELNEVQKRIPQIYCLNAEKWETLKDIPSIKNKELQSEVELKERINRYKSAIQTRKLKELYKGEDKSFLKSLRRCLSIGRVNGENLDRFTRLLVATHRINFNPEKFPKYEPAMAYLYEKLHEGYILFAISTYENEISLGLTGEFVVQISGEKAIIEDGAFSCGIIGRDFEQKAILALIDQLKDKGIKELEVKVKYTSTNIRVRQIFEEELLFNILSRNGEDVLYGINCEKYVPPKTYEWITVLDKPPELDYYGIPSVIDFFEKRAKPLFVSGTHILNLGSAHGEVIGHLQKKIREAFYQEIKKKKIIFTKIDMEYYPEEGNLIANAEDIGNIVQRESQDLVLAIELLEHTEHFWNIINEMVRVCKVGGYIFITVPSAYHYPKHEYPIDLWRIGPKTLSNFFQEPEFKIIALQKEGDQDSPRRTMILVQKKRELLKKFSKPSTGEIDWKTGITVFP